MNLRLRCAALLLLALGFTPSAADECTPPSNGPDVIIATITDTTVWGTVSGISGYTIGMETCNIGDAELAWNAGNPPKHPVFAPNLYRLKNNRFEQIGLGWVKHAGLAASGSTCCPCVPASNNFYLGVGCSDVYDADYNGQQGFFGPRSDVNGYTGSLPFPFTSQGQTGDAIFKRVQVHVSDVDPSLNAGARYFAEVQVVAEDEAAFGNGLNSASHREVMVRESGGQFGLLVLGSTRRKQPAIYAWKEANPLVLTQEISVPGEGLFHLAYAASTLQNSFWHYEYALFNLNSHRSARSFSVSVPQDATVTNIIFRDVDYHSGEVYDSTDWPCVHVADSVTWSTDSFEVNPNANALRWGTMYNFSFDANAPPASATITIGLFRPGNPSSVAVTAAAPTTPVPTASGWGLVIMALILCTAGTRMILGQRPL